MTYPIYPHGQDPVTGLGRPPSPAPTRPPSLTAQLAALDGPDSTQILALFDIARRATNALDRIEAWYLNNTGTDGQWGSACDFIEHAAGVLDENGYRYEPAPKPDELGAVIDEYPNMGPYWPS